ncbi:colicin V synthesis protein [Jejubacter calystegiae]|uniref:Colicin V synthesis protein n=1 Tax=Jejubacter calystegiae TaxID=2579935 RepID=A0A4P8YD36_9ENTR|nr:colicin V synthesis protein [Jejubacter calystegiae]QCT18391.1 colicin V synthesis protein [Jejubacter calystegiae]
MRELTTIEIDEVAGAYGNGFFSDIGEAIKSAVVGGVAAGFAGAIIGGKHGGDGGGVLGFGAIGQGVGMVAGGLIGLTGGVVASAAVGWDTTWQVVGEVAKGFANGTLVP